MMKASMATKCIDHMPPPIVKAAARQPYATRESSARRHAPAEIEGGVRCKGGDQNGQRHEIWIIYSGNDHRDCPNFRTRDQRATNPPTHLQIKAATLAGRSVKADVGRCSADDLVCGHQVAPLALC